MKEQTKEFLIFISLIIAFIIGIVYYSKSLIISGFMAIYILFVMIGFPIFDIKSFHKEI